MRFGTITTILTAEHFYYPKRNPDPLAVSYSLLLPSPAPGDYPSFCISWICCFWLFYINGIIKYMVFCDWVLSLSILLSSFIYNGVCIGTSSPPLFFIEWIILSHPFVWLYHILFIHSSVDEHFDYYK